MKNKIVSIFLFTLVYVLAAFAAETPPYLLVNNYTIENYKAGCQNWGFSLDSDGDLYVANNSGLLIFDGNGWTLYSTPDEQEVISVTNYKKKIYTLTPKNIYEWSMNEKGVYNPRLVDEMDKEIKFFGEEIKIPFALPAVVEKADPTAFATNGEYYFVGTSKSGLYILSPSGNVLTNLSISNQLQDNIVHSITVQDNSVLWLALDNGITRVTINPPIYLFEKRENIGKLENGFLDGNYIYMKTTSGVFKKDISGETPLVECDTTKIIFNNRHYDSNTIKEIFKNTSSLGEFANSKEICPIGSNMYWLSTENEAALFHEDNGTGTLLCRLLFDNYGLNLVSRGRVFFPLDENRFLVSTMQGACVVNIRDFLQLSTGGISSLLDVTRLEYVDDEGTHLLPISDTEINLPYDFKSFSVSIGTTIFTSNHYISYKIDGISNEWSKWQKDGTISFLQLPEGSYKLKIRRYVVKGPFKEIEMLIKVNAAWYNNILAWIIYLLLGALVVRLALKSYLSSIKKEELQEMEKQRNDERQRLEEEKRQLLEQEIQNKNNELISQTSLLARKNETMNKLLEELDKQKEALGERYPNKFYSKIKDMIEDNIGNKTDWIQFEHYFNAANQNFMSRLKQHHPEITTGDIRLCCLLRMNLSTKEISNLLNISVRAVELRRYRLRKRLEIEGDTNLVEYLMSL